MANNVAVFLDLDNLYIAANEAQLPFQIGVVLDKIKELTGGRIVLRRAYGDYRHNQQIPRQLAHTGFELQSVVRLNASDKNLADIQMVADAVETLIESYSFQTYVLITGDRDFMPLVQVLRRHNKHVIGVGVRHSASSSLVELCDQYLFYDDMQEKQDSVKDEEVRSWLQSAAAQAFNQQERVQASVFRELVQTASDERFAVTSQAQGSFSRLLARYPDIIALEREETTLFVAPAGYQSPERDSNLYLRYRSMLKKRGLRVIDAALRLSVLRDIVSSLQRRPITITWQQLIEDLVAHYHASQRAISKSAVNDILRLARRAGILSLPEDSDQPLASLPLTLEVNGSRSVQEAIMRCDYVYLCELQSFDELPFDLTEAARALYDATDKRDYLQHVLKQFQ